MLETMLHYNGIGLSAPQVGVSQQVIVFDTTEVEENGTSGIMFNPEILHGEKTVEFREGCLSLPHRKVLTKRSKRIKVKYLNMFNEPTIKEFEGLAAIVVQHEVDHLQGILLSDYEK